MENKAHLAPEPIATESRHSVERAIDAARNGRMVIIVDDADRENEGDLAMVAEDVTSNDINFMATIGRGLICTPMVGERLDKLGLPLMVYNNNAPMRTAFTLTVDAAHGITTGISASDRARTIRLLADDNANPQDFVSPGHIFPLRAHPGGVLARAGQTEGSTDLAILAGKKPVAVICEIMCPDGTMARMPELREISRKHGIPIVAIADMIAYRLATESFVEQLAAATVPTSYGEFKMFVYRSRVDEYEHVALVSGEIDSANSVLVRVHSECLTGDVFESQRCECGDQARAALKRIGKEGGVFVYMRQEGRGIGLVNKIKAYALQEKEQLDTVDANAKLGFPPDLRRYGIGAQILRDLNVSNFTLLTNNPKKVVGLAGFGLNLTNTEPLKIEPRSANKNYLKTKKERLGHIL